MSKFQTLCIRAWGGAPWPAPLVSEFAHERRGQTRNPPPTTDSDPPHLRSRSSFACVGTVHAHSLHSPRHLVVTAATTAASIRQPRSKWLPQRSSSSLRRPSRAAGFGNALSHYLRLRCMIPRHDLGSSPRHAACPAGLLPPLDGRRLFAGATHLPAMSSAAPLRLHATGCRAVCCASVLIPSPHADSRSCVSICPCDLGTGAAFVRSENQEWPVAGFSLLAILCRCLCVCVRVDATECISDW